jgi:hypothetical protein
VSKDPPEKLSEKIVGPACVAPMATGNAPNSIAELPTTKQSSRRDLISACFSVLNIFFALPKVDSFSVVTRPLHRSKKLPPSISRPLRSLSLVSY